MPDPIFEDVELAEIYDVFDGERSDLLPYLSIAKELDFTKVLDVGCGTGCFAHLLYEHEFEPTGLEPAKASLDIARSKLNGSKIDWIEGYLEHNSIRGMDAVFMTGNVAQVFVEENLWTQTLKNIHASLKPGGYLIFEVRDPAKEAWKNWIKEKTLNTKNIPNVGKVTGWCDLIAENFPLITFEWTYRFEENDKTIISQSTLIFRSKDQIESSLLRANFKIIDVRDAPDRPGHEFVFIAQKKSIVIMTEQYIS